MSSSLYHTFRKGRIISASLRMAPFRCVENPWLGEGYYFWDSFIELGKWWGEKHYFGNYVIGETTLAIENDAVFDLVGNTEHIKLFAQYKEIYENDRKQNGEDIDATPAQIIEHMKQHTSFGKTFKAIRVDGRFSVSAKDEQYVNRIKFNSGKPQYIDLLPPIQYCVFEKTDVNPLTLAYES